MDAMTGNEEPALCCYTQSGLSGLHPFLKKASFFAGSSLRNKHIMRHPAKLGKHFFAIDGCVAEWQSAGMNKIIVIHHSADFDGLFCREIARRHFGYSAEYIGWDYGQPEPSVPGDAALYMLDISVPSLMSHPGLNWVDHHKSAMDKYGKKPGYQIDGVAACRLAWQYFGGINSWDAHSTPTKEDFVKRMVTEPMAVRLAGEYDIWDRRDPAAELFQHGLRSRPLTDDIWFALLAGDPVTSDNMAQELVQAGKAIQYAKSQENADVVTNYGFDLAFEGLTFLACNHGRYNSHIFTAGLKPHHDACFGFNWDGPLKNWRVSLYHAPGKEHHDLSTIAVKYGGGGHRGACGFCVEKLPFVP